jgi:putative membrane protein
VFEWVKALHVLGFVSWMAGLLYLPRLMVYHCETVPDGSEDARFQVMERRLMQAIMNPAAVVTLASGGWLAWQGGFALTETWLAVKVAGVLGLLVVHACLSRHRLQFARNERLHSARYFRILNEVPTVLLVIVVIMVMVKPFR